MKYKLPQARWQIANPELNQVNSVIQYCHLSPLLARVIVNRGLRTLEEVQFYLYPQSRPLPPPAEEFPDLTKSVNLLHSAISQGSKIAICGDYDADGMTSTALLLRALRYLGADVDYEIPQRMTDGYGINERIVVKLAQAGVSLILTVDNGISAHQPIAKAKELGVKVIITDHHELPPTLPVADAILNPKLIPPTSSYSGLAGVGVAYLLARSLVSNDNSSAQLEQELLALYTLGTIADLAPLTGVNRYWLKTGLGLLPKSTVIGIQALMQVSGVNDTQKQLKPEDIGFRLGPRINAIGRINDPQIVIDLLTTQDFGVALALAIQCEQTNHQRQQMCLQIETEAISLIENTPIPWQSNRVLLVVKDNWHHGVIGIVASRLVERYGVPVFIGTYEDNHKVIRGSARGIEEFNVVKALEYSQDYLNKYGGHKAAGGFSLNSENLTAFGEKLSNFAHQLLQPEHLKPLVKIDAEASFNQLNKTLYQEIDKLHPWGIGNAFPIFWTPNVKILQQAIAGDKHLKLTLSKNGITLKAIAWRWGEYFPLPSNLDIAYKITENNWQGEKTIELELVGVRLPKVNSQGASKKARFQYGDNTYYCSFWEEDNEVRIKNPSGKVLVIKKGTSKAVVGTNRENAKAVDITKSPYAELVPIAYQVLFE